MNSNPDAPPAVPEGYARDAQGRLVPLSKVRAEDQLEDALVRGLIAGADELREFMGGFREKAFAEISALQGLLAEKFKTKLGGQKGNLQLTSFDGTLRVLVAVGDSLTFGPKLQVAKALIDECLVEWTEGGNDNVRALITDAFDVRKEGKLPVDRILSLRRLDIPDERWKLAMDAISEAIKVESSKSYIRFYRRESPEQPWTALSLDIAKL